MENFFNAIVAQDRDAVSRALQEPDFDVNQRDHVGRTPLHLALITGTENIACDLINANARMTARLADGRNALHLAAQHNLPKVLKKLFERSKMNQKEAERRGQETDDGLADMDRKSKTDGHPSSEDDWTSEDDSLGVVAMDTDGEGGDEKGKEGTHVDKDKDINEDREADDASHDQESGRRQKSGTDKQLKKVDDMGFPGDSSEDALDVLEVDALDWDLGFSPLAHAILFGSLDGINILLAEGADPALILKTSRNRSAVLHPLTLTLLRSNEDDAATILERLLNAGASTSTADENMRTIFHRAVAADKVKIVSTILKCDPNAGK
ncbi:hypothetical protein H0H92_008471, partial [Tricholoma furcatifolium]